MNKYIIAALVASAQAATGATLTASNNVDEYTPPTPEEL